MLIEGAYDADFVGHRKTEVLACDRSHRREIRRSCFALRVPRSSAMREMAGPAERGGRHDRTARSGGESGATRYLIGGSASSRAHRAIRLHWSIESSQHWVLDVAFGEDRRRQSTRSGKFGGGPSPDQQPPADRSRATSGA